MSNIRQSGARDCAGSAIQSRQMALAEAAANVIVGYGLAVVVQLVSFPTFGIRVSFGDNLAIGMIFTAVSMARSYALRRLFERIRIGGLQREAAALRRTAASIAVWVGQLPMR